MNWQERIEQMRIASKSRQVVSVQGVADDYIARREEAAKLEVERRGSEQLARALQKVPQLFLGKTFADFNIDCPEQSTVKNIVMRYVSTFPARMASGQGLIFEGTSGTGKTLLALIVYQALAKAGFTVHYEPSLRFLRHLRDKSFESYAAFQQLLTTYERCQLLMLDEVTEGIVKGGDLTAWEKEMLFALIDSRYQKKLCTLVMTNCHQSLFLDRLGNRITSRLREKSIFLAFNWDSYRQ